MEIKNIINLLNIFIFKHIFSKGWFIGYLYFFIVSITSDYFCDFYFHWGWF